MPQITQLLRRAAQVAPRRVATEFLDRTRTWERFADRVARLAGALAALGLSSGDRVGVMALNSDRYLECLFACPWGGFVVVPINTRLAPPEAAFWLGDSECSALFVDESFASLAAELRGRLTHLREIIFLGEGPTPHGMLDYETLIAGAATAADAGRGGDDLAALFYTGGTTGRSKGVMLSHRNIVANALNTAEALGGDEDTVYLHAAPMFHAADNAVNFVVTAVGGKHVFMPRFDPATLFAAGGEGEDHRDADRADHDQHDRQPSRRGERGHVFAETDAVRRLADAGSGDPSRFRRAAAHRLRSGLRAERGRAVHDVPVR